MSGSELAQGPANEFFPAPAFAGFDAVIDQLKLLLVQAKPNRRFRHDNHPRVIEPRVSQDARLIRILAYGVQPFGACKPDLSSEFRFAMVTGISGTSSFFFSSGLPFPRSSIIPTAERPITTG